MRNLILLAFFGFFSAANSNAFDINLKTDDLGPLETEMVSSEEIPMTNEERALVEVDNGVPNPASQFNNAVDPLAIADLLFRVWDIIQAHRPVVNVESKGASALPNIADGDWRVLTGWYPRRVITYNAFVKNIWGSKVVDLTYQVRLLAGGSVRGVGRYIQQVSVVPMKVDVKWGNNLDATVSIPSVINTSTEEDPLAAIYLDITYRISSSYRDSTRTQSYMVRGDGYMEDARTHKVYFEPVLRANKVRPLTRSN